MAIRIIKKGTLICDSCGKELADIRTSLENFKTMDTEKRFTEIRCVDCCKEKPLFEKRKEE